MALLKTAVADPDDFDADPDPALHFVTGLDPTFHFNTDPDPYCSKKGLHLKR
jgi:hypothetical protein